MKKILFITSQYRTGERIYPILPHLCEEFEVDLLKVYQMKSSHKWAGDRDLRKDFDRKYGHLFTRVLKEHEYDGDYDLIISDDNRDSFKTKLDQYYRNRRGTLVSFEHGNNDKNYFSKGYQKVFDKCFVFGSKDAFHPSTLAGGIPANDKLKEYQNLEKKHILIIVNFLGNRTSPFKVNFNQHLFEKLDLKNIQNTLNLPFLFKLKSRADDGSYLRNLDYLHNTVKDVEYDVIVDVEDDNKLIAESGYVIGAPSTLSFKPIQLGIPTVLIERSGQHGSFHDFSGLLNHNDDILSFLQTQPNYTDWVEKSIEGGTTFTSTQNVVNKIKELL